MKIETTQTQKLQNKVTNTRITNLKPIFKADLPDEFVSETMENAGEHNSVIGYILTGIATIGAGFAFFRNRKARIAKQIAKNEKEIAQRTKIETEDALAKLKAENEALNKALDEWHEAIIAPTKNKSPNKTDGTHVSSNSSSKVRSSNSGSGTQASSIHTSSSSDSKAGRGYTESGAQTASSTDNIGAKGSEIINSTEYSVKIPISEEDKKYFENEKQKLLEYIDKSIMSDDAKKESHKMVEELINDMITNSKGVEEDKKYLSEVKKAIDMQLEIYEMQYKYEKMMHTKGWNMTNEIRTKLANKPGFDRILGYQTQKDFLNEKLIIPLKTNGKTPNIIVMYGPKGTGKTLFGKAVAYEGNANHININLSIFPEENLQNLKDAVNKSKECFEKTGKKSILLLNEIDGVECNKEYIDILNNLSEKYHATLLATTNYPKKVDPRILNANNSEKLYMPTSSREDIAKILEYVLKELSDPGINFEELAKILTDKGNGAAYSNAKIYEIAEQITKSHYGEIMDKAATQKVPPKFVPVSEKEIIERLNKMDPDIPKEMIDSYKNIF